MYFLDFYAKYMKGMIASMINLTIIIPHFNTPSSLERLLNSIPILSDIQVLVIDDNSTKGISEYEALVTRHTHVSFFENHIDVKGAGSCRNIGLKHAVGRWVLFADADDFFVCGFYETIKRYLFSDQDIVFFPPTSLDTLSGKLSYRHIKYEENMKNYILKKDSKNELFLRYAIEVPWSKLINRNFIKKYRINFDEVIAANDVMFSTKAGHYMKNFDVSSKIIYCVTENKGSLTKHASEEIFNDRLYVFVNFYKFLKTNLSQEDFEILDITGTSLIINAIKFKFNPSYIINVFLTLRKNKIKLLNKKYFNPVLLVKRVRENYKIYKQEKKYYVK